ncbi:hypothetical protein [Sediminitomix flava]|uniref:Uncharacterized protein n=1 Tax=Sediminitomix flava TaxID=379075 RepID=A0A315Z7J2_SEDFL|nr:hypothetical protein [Sediminitomix flava]PWJ38571.1 hypothetical protein BC781_107161 [Sediminitomix flava]
MKLSQFLIIDIGLLLGMLFPKKSKGQENYHKLSNEAPKVSEVVHSEIEENSFIIDHSKDIQEQIDNLNFHLSEVYGGYYNLHLLDIVNLPADEYEEISFFPFIIFKGKKKEIIEVNQEVNQEVVAVQPIPQRKKVEQAHQFYGPSSNDAFQSNTEQHTTFLIKSIPFKHKKHKRS